MAKLKSMSLSVEKIELLNNHLPVGAFSLAPRIQRETGKISSDTFFTQLNLAIKSSETDPFPINLLASIRATFIFEDISDENEVNSYLRKQGVHILFPYLRSLVTNISATAMLPPIVLPIIDAFTFFPEDQQTGKK